MIYCAIIAFFLCFVFIFYISRHAWASIAHHNDVPLSTISKAMGHDSETTTQIYLSTLDTSVVDRANRKIMALMSNCGDG